MTKKTCSRCGTAYSGFFSRCPQCSYEEGTPLSNEDIEKYKVKEPQKEKNTISCKSTKLSPWYSFATILIIIESIALFVLFVLTITSDDADWQSFLIILGAYLFELSFLAIIQLLARIKQGIDNLQKQ